MENLNTFLKEILMVPNFLELSFAICFQNLPLSKSDSVISSFHFPQNYREPKFLQKFKIQFELAFRNLDVKLRLKFLSVRGIPQHIASTTNSELTLSVAPLLQARRADCMPACIIALHNARI